MNVMRKGGCVEEPCGGICRKQFDLNCIFLFLLLLLIWRTGPLVLYCR